MKKIQLLLLTLLIPFLGYTQINTFPWTHDFESFITLEEDTTDDGDWLLKQGPTSSFNTGPQGDHTTGNGIYYYVESSTPNYPGKVFTTYTPTFDISSTPGQVISFWYHMYGSSMGDLEVGIVDNNGYQFLDIISGDQGDEWQIYYSAIPVTDTFKIQFTATTGTLYYSDICIDDLYVGDPFTLGCMDTAALNYNPSAVIDDGSCAYPPCGGFLTSNAYQMCWGSQAAIQFEWTSDTALSQCDVIEIHVGDENGWSMMYGGYWPASNGLNGHAVAVGNGQMPPNWSVEHYAVLEYDDGTLSDTIFYTPTSCIPGCTDPTAISYNPWATTDDGSCGGTNCDPVTEQQVTMTIRLDNWPGETSWNMVTNAGSNVITPQGTYTFNDIGVTYTYNFCVSSTAGFEFILNDSYGDGLAGNGTPGAAGEVVIYDCNGDTITYLTSGTWVDGSQNPVGVNFGTVAYSGAQNGVACAGPPTIPGCLDPAYQEFDITATIDDSSCVNLHTFGCIDPSSFNYDASATKMDIVDSCNYILKIEDDAADGWGNSYVGVTQGTNTWTYTMGPGNYVQNFPLNLETDKPVTVYYFEIPNAQNPDPQQTTFQTMQNSFTLTNADGVVLLEEGTNPFANNGQGALQGFATPFWVTYTAMPYCGDYCIPTILGCIDIIAFNYDSTANTDDGGCIPVITGCTNSLAFNYDSLANTDDGSCVSIIIGCMDSLAFNFNPSANTNDQSSCIPVILGCMDDTMFNYNAAANTNDGTCIPVMFGCTDMAAFNYDPTANTNNGSCIPVVFGCTDPTMWNFDINANIDNSSCLPYVYGCTDSTAWNYDSLANTSVGCIPFYYGCTDPTMFNYDPNANTDDSSCIPYILGCNDITALNYDSTANVNTGCVYPILGCTDPTMFNYNLNANVDDGSCIAFAYGCTDITAWNYDSLANTSVGCIPFSYGCTDPSMFNYNPLANTDDGTCYPIILGCMDTSAFNYDPLANTNFGCNQVFLGCTDVAAFNYNYLANVDNGSCIPVVLGCIDVNALNFDSLANTNVGCIYPIPGCTDPSMFNYNPLANVNNGTCIPVIIGCTDPTALNFDSTANTNNGCIYPIYGCTDPIMFNYDPLANTNDGSCIPFVYGCTDVTAFNYNSLANTDNGSCIPVVFGCIDSTMFNYDPLANTDNNSCIPFIYGCTDITALNYNSNANTLDNSCCYIGGCTDSTAVNYNPLACFDDNSCIIAIVGCTDVSAYNYNPLANVTDSTACLYDAGCYGGPGIPYWLNDGCYAWVIDVDDFCCTNDWDASCQAMYDYCQLGWPTAVENISSLGIVVYPNPTKNVITIETRLEIKIEVYDIMGKLLIKEENTKRLDLSDLSNGLYNLSIIYNNKRYNKQIIKQ